MDQGERERGTGTRGKERMGEDGEEEKRRRSVCERGGKVDVFIYASEVDSNVGTIPEAATPDSILKTFRISWVTWFP